jgi:hypothetical protein
MVGNSTFHNGFLIFPFQGVTPLFPLTCAALYAAPVSKGVLEFRFKALFHKKWKMGDPFSFPQFIQGVM